MSQQAQAMVQAQQKTVAAPKSSILQRAALNATITPVHSGILQRCTGGIECAQCREKRERREGTMQRVAVTAAPTNAMPSIVHEVLNSSGQPLDARTRAFMEPRFGHDFSGVRVHTDAKAAESARAVNALAYTVGRDVVFGEGKYEPGTSEGRRLLAHELTHVVQQRDTIGSLVARSIEIVDSDDLSEREAGRAVSLVTAGQSTNVSLATSSPLCQRQEGDFKLPEPTFQLPPRRQPSLFPPGEELRLRPPTLQPMSQHRVDAFGKECPDAAELAAKKPIPSFNKAMFDAGYRTYFGLVTNMKVGPKDSYESCITEGLKVEENKCGKKGNMADYEPCTPKKHCMKVGETCGGDDLTKTTFSCSKTTFVDLHRSDRNVSLLEGTGKTACKVKCLQRYGCGGKEIGRFYITRNFVASEFVDGKNRVPITVGTIEKEPARK